MDFSAVQRNYRSNAAAKNVSRHTSAGLDLFVLSKVGMNSEDFWRRSNRQEAEDSTRKYLHQFFTMQSETQSSLHHFCFSILQAIEDHSVRSGSCVVVFGVPRMRFAKKGAIEISVYNYKFSELIKTSNNNNNIKTIDIGTTIG